MDSNISEAVVDDIDDSMAIFLLCSAKVYQDYFWRSDPTPMHVSILTGQMYYEELLISHANIFRTCARMDHETFDKLKIFLKREAGLKDSKLICGGQKILIFLYILGGHSIRDTASRWQHSLSTISVVTQEVDTTFLILNDHMIVV